MIGFENDEIAWQSLNNLNESTEWVTTGESSWIWVPSVKINVWNEPHLKWTNNRLTRAKYRMWSKHEIYDSANQQL